MFLKRLARQLTLRFFQSSDDVVFVKKKKEQRLFINEFDNEKEDIDGKEQTLLVPKKLELLLLEQHERRGLSNQFLAIITKTLTKQATTWFFFFQKSSNKKSIGKSIFGLMMLQ